MNKVDYQTERLYLNYTLSITVESSNFHSSVAVKRLMNKGNIFNRS